MNTLEPSVHMYNQYDFEQNIDLSSVNNRLFCTFTPLEELDGLIEGLSHTYSIMYNKMFVLHIKSNNEYVVTYNVDQNNVDSIPDNTILVHRKKES